MSNAGSFAPAVIRGRLVRRRKTFTWKSARTATRSSPANRSWLTRRAASSDSRRNTPKRTRRLPPDCGRRNKYTSREVMRIEDRGSRIEGRASRHAARGAPRSSILYPRFFLRERDEPGKRDHRRRPGRDRRRDDALAEFLRRPRAAAGREYSFKIRAAVKARG